jgi:hypothetical protein
MRDADMSASTGQSVGDVRPRFILCMKDCI